MNAQRLCTAAWLLIGMTRSKPGILKLNGERLTFISDEQERVFDVSLREVTDVKFPWYYFGGGLKLQIDVIEYRLSFIEPDDGSGITFHYANKSENITDLTGRAAGKAWRSVLSR